MLYTGLMVKRLRRALIYFRINPQQATPQNPSTWLVK